MTELRDLQHFVALFRRRSFIAAAEQQGVSQSTITKSIKRLEAQLGVHLFNRTTRSVEPTDSARSLLAKAENALQATRTFEEEANLLARGKLGAIRVGAIALATQTLVVSALARLAQSHPELEVEVVVGSPDIYHDLSTGECDVVVGDEVNFASSPHSAALRMEPISQQQLVFVHRAGHPAKRAATLDELLDFPLAIPSRYFSENRLFESLSAQLNRNVTPRYRLNSLSACLSLAATSDVITLAPRTVAESLIQASNPPTIDIANIASDISVRLAIVTVARNVPSPAVRAFHAALLQSSSAT